MRKATPAVDRPNSILLQQHSQWQKSRASAGRGVSFAPKAAELVRWQAAPGLPLEQLRPPCRASSAAGRPSPTACFNHILTATVIVIDSHEIIAAMCRAEIAPRRPCRLTIAMTAGQSADLPVLHVPVWAASEGRAGEWQFLHPVSGPWLFAMAGGSR